jgi:CubicO group peptidase (beta-lactamase class C family)
VHSVIRPFAGQLGWLVTVRPSNGGYGALGQMIADLTGQSYPGAVGRLVLEPLGMSGSWFPDAWPGRGMNPVIGLDRGDVNVAQTNRRVTIESVNGRVRHSVAGED